MADNTLTLKKKMKINLILKRNQIVLKYAKQGMPGRTGPMGLPGQDAVSWEAVITMVGIPNGECSIKLYKDGKLANNEIHYASVFVMPTHSENYVQSTEYSRTISGIYTFRYEGVRAIFAIIYDDSFAEKVLTAGTATMIRGRDLKTLQCAPLTFTAAEWRTKGTAGTSNVWTTGSAYDNSTLENGDMVIIPGTVSDQLDQHDVAVTGFIVGKAVIPDGGNASQAVTVISQAFIIGPAGAAATVQIGTVTTLPYDADATVVNSGTANNAVLDFGIPKGTPGEAVNTLPFTSITGNPTDNTNLANALNGKVAKAGDTMTGALNFANATWNKMGDDCQIGDCNIGGCVGLKGLNGATGLNFVQYNGTAAGKVTFDGSRFISDKGMWVSPGGGVSYIAGTGGSNAGLYVKKASLNADQWIPGITIQTKSGGGWAIGNYNNEQLQFVYGTKANIDANNNSTNIWSLNSDGSFTGKAANVTGTVAIANGGTGATTAASARQNLFPTNMASTAGYVMVINDNWATGGYIAKSSFLSWAGMSYSTTDLTAGTSNLTTGYYYFVYA